MTIRPNTYIACLSTCYICIILWIIFLCIYVYASGFSKAASPTDFTLPRSLIWNQFAGVKAVLT